MSINPIHTTNTPKISSDAVHAARRVKKGSLRGRETKKLTNIINDLRETFSITIRNMGLSVEKMIETYFGPTRPMKEVVEIANECQDRFRLIRANFHNELDAVKNGQDLKKAFTSLKIDLDIENTFSPLITLLRAARRKDRLNPDPDTLIKAWNDKVLPHLKEIPREIDIANDKITRTLLQPAVQAQNHIERALASLARWTIFHPNQQKQLEDLKTIQNDLEEIFRGEIFSASGQAKIVDLKKECANVRNRLPPAADFDDIKDDLDKAISSLDDAIFEINTD